MSKAVEILSTLNQPAIKLLETISGAIGKVYSPRHIRKMADAKAYEIKTITQALSDSAGIEIRYEKGDICANNEEATQFVIRTQSRMAFQELKKQSNIENVADAAYDILETEESCSPETVNSDWMTRFINAVEDISDEDMQHLWAKVLAGEVKQPNTFSLRTLDVLRNLSKSEAILFQNICAYVLNFFPSRAIPKNDDLLEQFKISYEDLIHLNECGLINTDGRITFIKDVRTGPCIATNHSVLLTLNSMSGAKKLQWEILPLTEAGRELLKLVNVKPNDEFLIAYGRILKDTIGENFTAYKILSQSGNDCNVGKKNLLDE